MKIKPVDITTMVDYLDKQYLSKTTCCAILNALPKLKAKNFKEAIKELGFWKEDLDADIKTQEAIHEYCATTPTFLYDRDECIKFVLNKGIVNNLEAIKKMFNKIVKEY